MPAPPHIAWFPDIGLEDRPTVGGKGGSLGELTRAGIAVPAGFVVRTAAFEQFLAALERATPVRARVAALAAEDLAGIGALSAELRARIERSVLPAAVLDDIAAAHAALCGAGGHVPLAVRSSATTEDAADASFAGLQDTYLWVTDLEQTLRYVRSCWASLYSAESLNYRRRRGIPEDGVAMGVVVQKMVDARTAGVMFTRSPLSGDRSVITIEGAWGLGSAVVGGEVTPDRWVIAKITGEIPVREISAKQVQHVPAANGGIEAVPVPPAQQREPCLSDAELQALRAVGRQVEKHYGRAQDIEWAVDRHSRAILLLQSRPETVWSAKDPVPVARAAADPLTHVMSIFGGKR
ncbi:MAG: PEP/pyruvate-binding domain-containing protein [Gammaproteobacteria bacterium]|nr:PEP/pyruvate-binding domain-containing protein [Gammaproteobacteria bacterium]